MRGVSRRLGRSAALLALVTVIVAHGAAASERHDDLSLRDQFERAKRFVITVLSRFNKPPG